MRLLYLPFDLMLMFCFQLAAAVFFLCDMLQRKWKYRLVINIILARLCNAPIWDSSQGCKLVSVNDLSNLTSSPMKSFYHLADGSIV